MAPTLNCEKKFCQFGLIFLWSEKCLNLFHFSPPEGGCKFFFDWLERGGVQKWRGHRQGGCSTKNTSSTNDANFNFPKMSKPLLGGNFKTVDARHPSPYQTPWHMTEGQETSQEAGNLNWGGPITTDVSIKHFSLILQRRPLQRLPKTYPLKA